MKKRPHHQWNNKKNIQIETKAIHFKTIFKYTFDVSVKFKILPVRELSSSIKNKISSTRNKVLIF